MEKEQLKEHGFNLDAYQVVGSQEEGKMAMDAALLTTPNMGVPVELLTYFDNRAIEVITQKRAATEIFGEYKAGTRADKIRKFLMIENTGYTQPYSDYSDNGKSDINTNYPARENYLFETVIKYGDVEQEETAKAKINLLSRKQASAATNIAIDFNRFYMSGVSGLRNYGILNAPNLPAAISAATGAGGYTTWATKTGAEIYADIVALINRFGAQYEQVKGLVTPSQKPIHEMTLEEFEKAYAAKALGDSTSNNLFDLNVCCYFLSYLLFLVY